ncbi:ABC transporter substrate-binding protein [Saccharibacillus sp. CPCC 101409]|uniref:ABC transporter substrate-binding protein n=1 Tax=Saccharibacillus sp. CPCC 101409 TaxID=3058041 RepID=UPI0026738E9A|nr:ABC transporter substrate-binding protein [Saccharibacillus sp. CPCC 101409]MDO3409292.1 ABC transporter substrate-binding protein [Saccharibacillus sp. CPCC 101409]
MRQKRKLGSLLLAALLLLATLLTACGGTKEKETAGDNPAAGGSDSEAVTLKMLLIGGKPVDYDEVFGKLNEILKEKINTTVEAEFLDWSDWTQKYPLKFAASEDFDIVYTANWAYYNDQALKGGFLELTEDMLKEHAPKTFEALPQTAWDQAKVNGKLYMVPQNSQEVIDKVVLIRQDLVDKYKLDPVTDPATYAEYVKAVPANEKGVSGFGAKPADGWKWHELDDVLLEQQNQWSVINTGIPLAYSLDDESGKVFNVYDTPEFRELLSYYKDLADNGGWSKNIVNNKNDVWQDMKAGKVASYAQNLGTVAFNVAEARRDTPQYDMMFVDLTPDKYKTSAISTQNGLAIHATSKHAERALELIDLLQNDREIHDLTMYGIADKHYKPIGDDRYEPGPSAANYTGFSNWGWNSLLNRTDTSYPKEADDMLASWQDKVHHSALETFVFDDTNVKNQVASIGNVMLRYAIPLEYGLIQDLDKGQADLIKQLQAAGLDKVQTEMQTQIDAFLAAQN